MKKKLLNIILVLVLLLGINVNAKTTEGFYADESLTLNKEIGTTTFAAGNNVNVSSKIDGISFIAGNNVTLSGNHDYLFTAGNNIVATEITTKDAFIAGNVIKINACNIRDLYVAGETVTIDSNIGRNIYAGGNKVIINGTIEGNVTLGAEEIVIGKETVIKGTLKYPEDSKIDLQEGSKVESIEKYEVEDINVEVSAVSIIQERIISFVSILLIALILLALNKDVFKKIAELEKSASFILKNTCIGFGYLLLIPIVAIIALITVIGIPLSIISLLIYGIMIYLSVIATSYYLGNWILKDKINNEYLLLTVSLLAIYILKLIPIIGGLVSFISLCLGLSIYINLIISKTKQNK